MYTLKVPTCDDLTALYEWHKGRMAFGLWYVPVPDEPAYYCQKLREQFCNILAPNYERVFHITVFVVGFCGADDFGQVDLAEQIKALARLNLPPFELSFSSLGTFDNSLHIKINPHFVFDDIRQTLSATHQEISPAVYVPHITLGFYQDNYPMADILDIIQTNQVAPKTFLVDKLIFGTYVPTQPQGKLSCEYQLLLSGV
ncbi:2'-5' RNA ligase family protein [Moraxella sp. VT-16-12]|uniref:2'-5' RNA ligase family protein n=1 Tax=Moraxella sp. VT-16-12 TaxID=2014877 RepID=UPI001646A5A8|nr:2'-5' RNA ligase family protein [Moraxella sp. VT-16-12]